MHKRWRITLILFLLPVALVGCDPLETSPGCTINGLPEIAFTGITANDQWASVICEFNGVEMVLVPAGCFKMGYDGNLPEERPVHEICFEEPFWIDRTEVTVSQFADFLNGQPEPVDPFEGWLHGPLPVSFYYNLQLAQEDGAWHPLYPEEQRPLENVTWYGATDYCAWRDARLPTEAEWEYAARGPGNLLFPWGNEYIKDNIVRFKGSNPDVGSKPQGASWVGALDMSGSVFEWTSSLFKPYPYDAADGREASLETAGESHRVFRGSAWYHAEGVYDNVSAIVRFDARPNYAAWYYGFRCARSID
jgi:formylglycine-generating enzyme required for sulfatase activity